MSWLTASVGVGAFSTCYIVGRHVRFECLDDYYSTNLRGSLFSGFLTLTGFLFTVKSFLITNMKKEVYDHDEYTRRIADLQHVNPDLGVYGPLKNLSTLLFVSVFASLLTSVSQFTIGLLPYWWAAPVCLTFTAVTVSLLVYDLFVVRSNLSQLFGFLDAAAQKRIEREREKARAAEEFVSRMAEVREAPEPRGAYHPGGAGTSPPTAAP